MYGGPRFNPPCPKCSGKMRRESDCLVCSLCGEMLLLPATLREMWTQYRADKQMPSIHQDALAGYAWQMGKQSSGSSQLSDRATSRHTSPTSSRKTQTGGNYWLERVDMPAWFDAQVRAGSGWFDWLKNEMADDARKK